MKLQDILLAIICGLGVGEGARALFINSHISFGFWMVLVWILLPLLSVFCLYIVEYIGNKYLVLFQVAKHILIGALATAIDLLFFEGLLLSIIVNPLIAKAISFIISTLIKYAGNKYWVFQKYNHPEITKEVIQFFSISLVGLLIDLGIFYCATKIVGAPVGVSLVMWTKVSVLIAAVAAALWNFLGYKFLVFRK